jgi:hypothetical protein
MTEVQKFSDYLNPLSHREPKWPVGGFAPGGYANTCHKCKLQFSGMDKRAYSCFPCAIEELVETNRRLAQDLFEAKAKIDALTSNK